MVDDQDSPPRKSGEVAVARSPTKKRDAKDNLKQGFWISAVLTLVTWLFFRYSSVAGAYPIGASGTTVIFAFWLILVGAILFAWRRFHARKES